jgi:glycosyltransferase involved in cell wall biosynthesis
MTKPDIVLATYPPIETLDVALYLSEKFDLPLVADFRDGLMFEPVEPGMLRSNRTRARYQEVEGNVARNAAGIITVSDPISDYFRNTYESRSVRTVPNGFDPDESATPPSSAELDSRYFNMVYTGRLGLSEKGRQASVFIETLTRLVRDVPQVATRLRLHLVGEFSVAERAQLGELADRGSVRFHGLVDRSRALGFQRAADLLLLIATTGKTSVATSKLFEYLNAGQPILGVTRNTAAEKIILETQAGVVVDPVDADAIYSVLRRLITEPSYLESINPRPDAIARYSRPRQMEELAAYLRELAAVNAATTEQVLVS